MITADQVCTFPKNRHSGPRWPALPCVGAWLVRLPSMVLAAVVRMLLIAQGCAILRKQRQNPLPGLVPRKPSKRTTRACVFFCAAQLYPQSLLWRAGQGSLTAGRFPLMPGRTNPVQLATNHHLKNEGMILEYGPSWWRFTCIRGITP